MEHAERFCLFGFISIGFDPYDIFFCLLFCRFYSIRIPNE